MRIRQLDRHFLYAEFEFEFCLTHIFLTICVVCLCILNCIPVMTLDFTCVNELDWLVPKDLVRMFRWSYWTAFHICQTIV